MLTCICYTVTRVKFGKSRYEIKEGNKEKVIPIELSLSSSSSESITILIQNSDITALGNIFSYIDQNYYFN